MSAPGPNPLRLHVGAGDPLGYGATTRAFFGDGTWVHLHSPGETADDGGPGWRRLASRWRARLSASTRVRHEARRREREAARRTWRYMPVWIDATRALPFRDGVFAFALSEHVVEHLFMHEAFRLMQEVRRVLAPGGVFRVSVPDADLRPGGLEPLAFHAGRGRTSHDPGRWNDPAVHKIRFNLYGMTFLMEQAGFTVKVLRAFDRDGAAVGEFPAAAGAPYAAGADWPALLRQDYLRRPDSLIVDGIR
ncbi:MAG TPA: methyltransferase domain-containing protein [Candidatus Polarisedimenticolia bacterium]|nr:methyltransferase domain-containing protein [Candidatus Polarisedimenticolia bacterium]